MSFWGDFGAGFFNDQARQMQQAEQLSIADAIEERRRARQLDDEKRLRQWRREDQVDTLNAQAQPVAGYGDDGQVSLLKPRFDTDAEGRLRRTDQVLGKPLLKPTGKYRKATDGDEFVTYRELSDGVNFTEEVSERAPRYKPDSGGRGNSPPRNAKGLTPYQEEQARLKEAERVDSRVSKELTRFDSVVGKLDSKDWQPDAKGYVKAAQVLESQFKLPRGLRNYADARDAFEQATRAKYSADLPRGRGDATPAPPAEYPNAVYNAADGQWYVEENGRWSRVEMN